MAIFRDFSVFRPTKNYWGLAPIWVRRCKLHVPRYRLVKVKIRSAVPENGSHIFGGRKKNKKKQNKTKQKKTSAKHICYRLIGGCVK